MGLKHSTKNLLKSNVNVSEIKLQNTKRKIICKFFLLLSNGYFAALFSDNSIYIYEPFTFKLVFSFYPELNVLTMFQIENENLITVGQYDKMFKIWKITKNSYSLIKVISIQDKITNAIPLANNDIAINCETSRKVSIWNLHTFQCVSNILHFSSFFIFFTYQTENYLHIVLII